MRWMQLISLKMGAEMEKQKIREIEKKIYSTLQRDSLTVLQVINACDILSQRIRQGQYHEFLNQLLKAGMISHQEVLQTADLLSRKILLKKVENELGKDRAEIYPLGVLFHVNPENSEGIAAYSVIEGLLAGNINLVKLPSSDHGITEFLLKELTEIEPLLKEYVCLFSIRSGDVAMKMIASLADAVIVWGGDDAVKAVRALAGPNQKVIEWGHKISFAYITSSGISDENMKALSEHIVQTRQLFCSSCQGIYLDGFQKKEIADFCRKMLCFLMEAVEKNPEYDIAWTAKCTLNKYTYMLERKGVKAWGGKGINLLYCRNQALEPAIKYGNIWVKTLSRPEVVPVLKKYHGYLQTVGLVCNEEERQVLSELFIKAGATNIRDAKNMSSVNLEDSHDGEYPLRRYTKIVRKLL